MLSSLYLMPALSMMKHRSVASAGSSKCLQLGHSRISRRAEGAACPIFRAQSMQPDRVLSTALMPVWTAISSARWLQSRQYVPAGGADAGLHHDQDASLVLHQKINNRNRRLSRGFQHKVVATDADLDAGGAPVKEPSERGLALEHAKRRITACFPSASPKLKRRRPFLD